jgi:stress-induced morphogen
MPIEQNRLENLLKEKFPDSKIIIEDLAGDNDHYSVFIESSLFNDL